MLRETTFRSNGTFSRPVLVMKPQKKFQSDGVLEVGKRLHFKNYKYTTMDEEEIQFIRSLPTFGTEYVELKADESMPEYKPNPLEEMGVTKMGEEVVNQIDQIRAETDQKLADMQNAILAKVADVVSSVLAPVLDEKEKSKKTRGKSKE